MAQMMQNGSPGSAGANSRKDVRFIGDVMGSYVLAARAHTGRRAGIRLPFAQRLGP
jgi:hypothetical protein